ncbi:RAMP superfamily CRISPR-associated protein [Pauljensenia sp. 27098_8_83]|jgi:hypothetical protein avisC_11520
MSKFHHAYNGIPTVNRNKSVQFKDGTFDYAPLDYIAPDRLSGFIDVKIETMTPTLPGFKTRDGAIAVPSASGNPDGARSIHDAFIPATALKGMLSSAYEAVTMSRLRIFDQQHKRVYSHRPPARKAQSTYPAFLTHNGSYWEIIFPFQENNIPKSTDDWKKWRFIGLIDSIEGEDGDKNIEDIRTELQHLTEVRYKQEEKEIQNNATRLIATHVQTLKDGKRQPARALGKNLEYTDNLHLRGFIVRTRNDESQPINSKHKRYEFIFPFVDRINKKKAYRNKLDTALIKNFLSTLHDYAQNCLNEAKRLGYTTIQTQSEKRKEAAQSALSNTPRLIHEFLQGKLYEGYPLSKIDISDQAIEEYLKDYLNEAHAKHAPGIPIFISLNRDNKDNDWEVAAVRISPVGRMIGKHSVSAYKLAQDQGITPANSLTTITPGDSLWGFTPQSNDDNDKPSGGLRGRILIEAAHFTDRKPKSSDRTTSTDLLKIHNPPLYVTLSSPKPQTGVPYLRDSEGLGLEDATKVPTKRNPVPRDHTFLSQQTLIRKVYPTHRNTITAGEDQVVESTGKSSTTSSIASWIEPEAIFRTRIHFINLSEKELAVLLWLLKPSSFAKRKPKLKEGYHHIGLGKPLGMGTVRVEATACQFLRGQDLITQYSQLDGVFGHFDHHLFKNGQVKTKRNIDIDSHINAYLPESFRESLPVKSFCVQARGWNDNVPVSYPVEPTESSDSSSPANNATLNWFKKREDNRVKLASLYEDGSSQSAATQDKFYEQVEAEEKKFGPFSFEILARE